MGGAWSTQGDTRNAYKTLVGKPVVKEALRRFNRVWENNIKICFKIVYEGENRIKVTQESSPSGAGSDVSKSEQSFSDHRQLY